MIVAGMKFTPAARRRRLSSCWKRWRPRLRLLLAAEFALPTQHALWRGQPTTAKIASVVNAYDAVFIIGGRSLITILYSEGEAIPECAVYQLSADMNELGRTYATPSR
jgi:hypothetical protein